MLLPLAGVVLVVTGCADRASTAAPPSVSLQPMPPAPGPLPHGLLPEGSLAPEELGAEPAPYEQSALNERLHALVGGSPDFGGLDARDRAVLVVRWFGDPPAELLALVDEYADAPFDVRVEPTTFRPGDLADEARRLLQDHPGVVTGTFPRTTGDGIGVGIDPSVATDPDRADLDRLGVTSRFPLFPEPIGRPVPATG
ncbi:hypothetical protein SAMN05216574_11033 [Blastococcus tunisiensis]|uniref:Uncharacterized protein n=1 Tax=Blastococcus tunisiensis TaxID=1798228 RepID=A0A1I2GWU3_9ACTN|nr:hypothetical protein SAMN05216574_11033 [Blastococcus sp. DSM 46838]